MKRTVSVTFTPEGVGRCLYTEAIDLQSLGRLNIRRATFIEFDNESQLWEVFMERGQALYCSSSREECLEWEQQHFKAQQGGRKP